MVSTEAVREQALKRGLCFLQALAGDIRQALAESRQKHR